MHEAKDHQYAALQFDQEPMIESDFDHYKITFSLTVKMTTYKTTDKDLSDMEMAILYVIVADPGISQKDMAKKLGLSVDGIRHHTDKLKERKQFFKLARV